MGHQVLVGASIGIAFGPGDGDDADKLLKNADMALYRAKADGKAAFRFFEAEMDARAQARRRLEMDLRQFEFESRFDRSRKAGAFIFFAKKATRLPLVGVGDRFAARPFPGHRRQQLPGLQNPLDRGNHGVRRQDREDR